jgi:CRP-like cAMP-binding protein
LESKKKLSNTPIARKITPQSEDLVPAFRNAGLLIDLDDHAAATLLDRLRPRVDHFRDGHFICRSGGDADRFWIIVSGAIRIVEKAQGAGRNVTTRHAGEVVGEAALLRHIRKRNADMVATGSVEAIVVDYGCVTALEDWRLVASLYKDFAQISAEKLSQATQRRADLPAITVAEDELLRRFVPAYALSSTRATDTGIRSDYPLVEVVLFFFRRRRL